MALQPVRVELSNESTKDFTFNKPVGDYGKGFGLTLTFGGGTGYSFAPDVDNLDGTMTGTVNFDAPVTGFADIHIYDRA